MTWWTIRNSKNDKILRVPADGGEVEIYENSKYLPGWTPLGKNISLDEILEMFLYHELKVYLGVDDVLVLDGN